MTAVKDPELEFLGEQSLEPLNHKQQILYAENWQGLVHWLRTEGKWPNKNVGYSESNIRPLARRIHQVFEYAWESDRFVLELSTEIADQFVEELRQDEITIKSGDPYSETSKRKHLDAIHIYFRFIGREWEPEIAFVDDKPTASSDPINRRERELLMNAALEYKSPPNYGNLTPDERDRWKAQIAQYLGKPKEDVSPSDFNELRRTWKYASLISTTLDAGWRAGMVGRLLTTYVDLENGEIHIPAKVAVKNDESWTVALSKRSVKCLEKWLDERENNVKYDAKDNIWLNRHGNPYTSANLNNLLGNLLEEADIDAGDRKITWHSLRHSTGMYIYESERDLGLVAEILRHKSIEAARKYAHPTPETKKDVIERIQGGGI